MPIITCPSCNRRYDPRDHMEDAPEGRSTRVACPACGQWVRLPDGDPIPPPRVPRKSPEGVRGLSRLVDEPVILECPDCSMKLKVKSAVKPGQRVRCPKCTSVFAPEPPEPAPSTAIAERLGPKRRPLRRPDPDEEDEDEREEERDEQEEEEEEEERPRRRKRRRRKSAAPLGMWLGIGGGVLAGVVFVLVLVLKPFGGGTYAKYEKEVKEVVRLMTELLEVMDSVKDRATARTAAQRIHKICDQLDQMAQRLKELPPLSRAEDKRLEAKYKPEMDRINGRAFAAGQQAGMNSQGEPSFVQAAQRLVEVGSRLQSVTQGRVR